MKIDYYAYRSGMRKWNAGFKVLLAVATVLLVITIDQMAVSLFVILTVGILTLAIGKLPWKIYLYYMTIPITFILLSGIMIAAEFSMKPLEGWNLNLRLIYICVTQKSLWAAIQVSLKAMAGMSALYMMVFSTTMSEFIRVLQKAHVPGLIIELMHLIYRYIFILLEAAGQMQIAARTRLGYSSLRQGFRTFAGIAGSLFLLSMKKANAYYDALVARGYHGALVFLEEEHPVKWWQIAGSAVYFVLIGVIAGR